MAKFKVPRLYRAAAKVAKVIKEENGKLEDLVQENNKKTNVKALAALVNKCLNNEKMLDAVINNSEILVKEKFDNVWVVRILITELLIGKHKLPIGSPTIQTILAYGPVLKTEHLKAQGKHRGKGKKHGGALKAEEGENSESELIEEPTEGSEQAKSGSKAPLKRKRSNAVSEANSKNQNSKSKKRKGENERYFELKAEDSDKVLEEHKGPGTKKAKKKKRKHAAEENDDKPTPDTITLGDDASDEGKPLWGKQKDYIKIEDASIKSKFDQPKKKKKSYPVKKDKFSAEKKFSKFQKKFKKGKNKFNRDN